MIRWTAVPATVLKVWWSAVVPGRTTMATILAIKSTLLIALAAGVTLTVYSARHAILHLLC